MELTPEERQKIYESEKARIEAQAKIKGERRANAVQKKVIGCFVASGIIVFLIIVLVVVNSKMPKVEESAAPPTNPALLQQSEELIQDGRQAGVLSEVSMEADYTRVVVGPAFYLIDFKAKEGFCRAISYAARARGCPGDFMLRDSRTDKHVGSFVSGILKLK